MGKIRLLMFWKSFFCWSVQNDDMILSARRSLDGIDRIVEEILAYVELVVVVSGSFLTLSGFIPDHVHDVSSGICHSYNCLSSSFHTYCESSMNA